MPRPCKRRRIRGRPNSSYFKPAGIPINSIEETMLNLDEFEAIRFIDFQEISQEQAAKKMEALELKHIKTLGFADPYSF